MSASGTSRLTAPPAARRNRIDRAVLPAPDRSSLLQGLVRRLTASGVRWAFQGPAEALDAWQAADDAKDLDLWVASHDADQVDRIIASLGGVRVASSSDPRRLQHTSWWVEVAGRGAIIDVTAGDLAVGPVVLCPEREITIGLRPDEHLGLVPVLADLAAALDLAARPLLRGRAPEPTRLEAAREAWRSASAADKIACAAWLEGSLGSASTSVVEVLRGMAPTPRVLRRIRRALVLRTVAPRSLRASWSQRWSIVPTRRPNGPAGIRSSGTLVVLVGTDGSGKSTLAANVAAGLEQSGFQVGTAYFGMAHGNLPGVAWARRRLGVAPAGSDVTVDLDLVAAEEPAVEAKAPAADLSTAHPKLRTVAAWYYAVEYVWRYVTLVMPRLRKGEVVICDRYVYDLRWSPRPGSRAAAVAQRLVGRPHVLVLPDAPAALIFDRKPERTELEIAQHQAAFRSLLAEQPAICRELVVDTSGADPDPAWRVRRTIVAAAHRRTARGW